MTLDSLIMLAGAFVAILPFLGFPSSWDKALLVFIGICIVGFGIAVRRRTGSKNEMRGNGETYIENGPQA